MKGNGPVVNIPNLTWSLFVKMGGLRVFGHRVRNISAGQTENIPGQAIKGNQQGSYINRQASFILPTHGLSFVGSVFKKVSRDAECIIWIFNTPDSVQIGFCFLPINLRFSLKLELWLAN